VALTLFVVAVPFQGGDRLARYVVGARQKPSCPCNGKELPECIGVELTFNPVEVESCFSHVDIQLRKLMLALPYLGIMTIFGLLVGAVILQQTVGGRNTKRINHS
jgi:hypothetical protein